ncbi:MAG TPA: hypothetical protein VFL67_05025 [Mycobacterium sp.]|nr:hypothetical protein [Mycobacterium sp.]
MSYYLYTPEYLTGTNAATALPAEAAATGAANDASVAILFPAENTAGTGVANDATVNAGAPAGNAASTGTANDASVAIIVPSTVATGTGTANDAAATVLIPTVEATGTGVANDATVATSGPAPAIEATATGTAPFDTAGGVASLTLVSDAAIAGTGQAFDPGLTVAPNADFGAATGTANNAAVAITANDSGAAGTGSALDGIAQVTVFPTVATATGVANDVVFAAPGLGLPPEAAGTGSAPFDTTGGSASLTLISDAAIDGTGLALDATVRVTPPSLNASAAGAALDAAIHIIETELVRLVYGAAAGEAHALDPRARDPRRIRTQWSGLAPRVRPIPTPNGILLWQDGRLVVTPSWENDPRYWTADDRIAGGSPWVGMSDSWQADVLRAHGFTLEPVS